MIPAMRPTKTRSGRTTEMMQLAVMMKMQTRAVRLMKMRTTLPMTTTTIRMTIFTIVHWLKTMTTAQLTTQSIVFHCLGGLVQAASQRVVVQISPTLMVCLNKRQRRCR